MKGILLDIFVSPTANVRLWDTHRVNALTQSLKTKVKFAEGDLRNGSNSKMSSSMYERVKE